MADETGITVVRGRPDAVEIAAVTAVLMALLRDRGAPPDTPAPAARADWIVKDTGGRGPVSWSARPGRGPQ
ncbi:acyl-CoA carboxylase subunit epsilon [Streptomyces sp. NPDC127049]|uniref:acyl-CoA carboxylase subunit epsilon n=1 Tax=unclassified Streptomyces TaxID=2593676 RepID=UPI0036563A15